MAAATLVCCRHSAPLQWTVSRLSNTCRGLVVQYVHLSCTILTVTIPYLLRCSSSAPILTPAFFLDCFDTDIDSPSHNSHSTRPIFSTFTVGWCSHVVRRRWSEQRRRKHTSDRNLSGTGAQNRSSKHLITTSKFQCTTSTARALVSLSCTSPRLSPYPCLCCRRHRPARRRTPRTTVCSSIGGGAPCPSSCCARRTSWFAGCSTCSLTVPTSPRAARRRTLADRCPTARYARTAVVRWERRDAHICILVWTPHTTWTVWVVARDVHSTWCRSRSASALCGAHEATRRCARLPVPRRGTAPTLCARCYTASRRSRCCGTRRPPWHWRRTTSAQCMWWRSSRRSTRGRTNSARPRVGAAAAQWGAAMGGVWFPPLWWAEMWGGVRIHQVCVVGMQWSVRKAPAFDTWPLIAIMQRTT